MRHISTDAEQALWWLLRSRQLQGFKFRRQTPIGRYVVDFVCHEAHLILEVDGSQHADRLADMDRDKWLKNAGYRVLRFWDNDVLTNSRGVLEAILSEISEGGAK
jgi:very-short-patch-repair endonuclease